MLTSRVLSPQLPVQRGLQPGQAVHEHPLPGVVRPRPHVPIRQGAGPAGEWGPPRLGGPSFCGLQDAPQDGPSGAQGCGRSRVSGPPWASTSVTTHNALGWASGPPGALGLVGPGAVTCGTDVQPLSAEKSQSKGGFGPPGCGARVLGNCQVSGTLHFPAFPSSHVDHRRGTFRTMRTWVGSVNPTHIIARKQCEMHGWQRPQGASEGAPGQQWGAGGLATPGPQTREVPTRGLSAPRRPWMSPPGTRGLAGRTGEPLTTRPFRGCPAQCSRHRPRTCPGPLGGGLWAGPGLLAGWGGEGA